MLPSILRLLPLALLAAGCSSDFDSGAELLDGKEPRTPAKPRLVPESLTLPEPSEPVGGSPSTGAPSEPSVEGCERSTFVLRPDLSNARDLGGVPVAGGTVACGAVFRGPPLRLTEQGCSQLSELGVRTVIDLRTESERIGTPQSECVTSEVVTAPLPIPYGVGPEDYSRDLNTDESVAQVFRTLGDPSAYPVYFHCTYGRDRTGIIGALVLLALGASRQAVMDEYMLSEPNVGAFPVALDAVLDEVEQRGGAEALLLGIGITAEELAVLRERAISN